MAFQQQVSELSCMSCCGAMQPWLYMPVDPLKNEPIAYSTVVRCEECGMGSLSPIPAADDIPGFYELESYYTHGNGPAATPQATFAEKVLGKLAWLTDRSEPFDVASIAHTLRPGSRICDLGCGDARYLRAFKDLGFEAVGVDPDPRARDAAERAGVTVLEGTAEDVSSLRGKFDLVIMTHSLEHCRNPVTALANAFRLTNPGGRCYVEVPNCAAEPFRMFNVCSIMFDAPRHIHFFTPNSLAVLAERTGFKVLSRNFDCYVRGFSPERRAYEASNAAKATAFDHRLRPRRHTFTASVIAFMWSFWRSPERKYDSFGLLLQRQAP